MDNLYKPFKVHDFEQLLILSGLFSEFMSKMDDPNFKSDFAIVSTWEENVRYESGKVENNVKDFIESIKNLNVWLQKFL